MNLVVNENNCIKIGTMNSISFQNKDTAQKVAESIIKSRVIPNARFSKDGWIATIEDRSGYILLYKTGISTKNAAIDIAVETINYIS